MWKAHIAALAFAIPPVQASALSFATCFVEYELPKGWTCKYDEPIETCQKNGDPSSEAYIIARREKQTLGKVDPEAYLEFWATNHFSDESKTGRPLTQKVITKKRIKIHGQTLADSLRFESDRAGYYTRYLVGLEKDKVVVVRLFYPKKPKSDFSSFSAAIVKNLRVFNDICDRTWDGLF